MCREIWTFEKCKETALLYNHRNEFKNKHSGAYSKSLKNGWLDEICSHMIRISKPKSYWNKEKCLEAAKECIKRSEFAKRYPGAYKKCFQNKWLDEVCNHMIIVGNLKKRIIYLFEFKDKFAYIGLTCDVNRRKKEHLENKDGLIYNHINKTGEIPILILLTEYIELEKSIKLEKYYMNFYKNNGFKLLNKYKGGGIGKVSKKIPDYYSCKLESKKYKSRTEFHDKNHILYNFSKSNIWLDEFYGPIISRKIKPTYEECLLESKKYKSKSEFSRKSRTIYNFSSKNGWLDIFYFKYSTQS